MTSSTAAVRVPTFVQTSWNLPFGQQLQVQRQLQELLGVVRYPHSVLNLAVGWCPSNTTLPVLLPLQLLAILVPFAAGRFEIEGEILHIEPQLA